MKVIAVVKFNSGEALVLDESPKLSYVKESDVIVGTDGTFCSCYFYETPGARWQAFAGRKFDIELANGEIEHCHGQWWDGVKARAVEILGTRPIHVTANSIDRLKDCYVFYGYTAIPSSYQALRAAYKGVVWEYYDYERTITTNPYRKAKGLTWLRKYRNQRRPSKLFSK